MSQSSIDANSATGRRLLLEVSFSSTEEGTTSYLPVSGLALVRHRSDGSSTSADSARTEVLTPSMMVVNHREVVRDIFMTSPARAQEFLEFELPGPLTVDGWCLNSPLAPSKDGGYIQLSGVGANKFCVLQELLA